MSLVVPDQGEDIMLQNIVNKAAAQNLVLKLYTNNITPSESDTEATYIEASGFGYSAITLSGLSWNTVVRGDPSYIDYPKQAFNFTGALGNVYGYFMVQLSTGFLVYAERFTGAPFNIVNNGDKIEITPKIELSS
jgi:hypothetical protein